jgi:hypothetical protein
VKLISLAPDFSQVRSGRSIVRDRFNGLYMETVETVIAYLTHLTIHSGGGKERRRRGIQ